MDIGPGEVILVLAIALLFLGPTKLPGLARSLGEALREFRSGHQDATTGIAAGGERR